MIAEGFFLSLRQNFVVMKKINYVLYCIVALVLMTAACSRGRSGDVKGLLQTVPADASAVAVVDLNALPENVDDNLPYKLPVDATEENGVDRSVAAFFIGGYNSYITGFLEDTDKFKASVEKETGEAFRAEGDVAVSGNIAVISDRFWVCVSSRNTVNTDEIKHFTTLSEKQSILSNEVVAGLEEMKHDVSGWGDIKGCMNAAGLDFATRATATMAVEAMFVDAVEFSWNMDFKKSELLADLNVLNSKGGIAKFNFPAAKIDEATVAAAGSTADGVVALAVSPEMVKKLREETGGKGFSMIGVIAGMISCVDGTCAAAVSESGNMTGVIATTGRGTTDLSSMLSELGMTVSKEGNLLRFGKGEVSGGMSVSEAAAELKGSMAGAVYSGKSGKVASDKISSVVVTLNPEKGGLAAHVKVRWKE